MDNFGPNIFLTHNSKHEPIFFVAEGWHRARKLAPILAGKRHRGIFIIPEQHHLYKKAIHELGLVFRKKILN